MTAAAPNQSMSAQLAERIRRERSEADLTRARTRVELLRALAAAGEELEILTSPDGRLLPAPR